MNFSDAIKTHARDVCSKKENNFLLSVSRSNVMMIMMCVNCCCVIHFSTFRYSRSRIAWCCCDCDWCSLFSFVRVSTRAGVAWCQIGVQKPAHAFFLCVCVQRRPRETHREGREFFSIAGGTGDTFFFFKQRESVIKNAPPFFWLILSKNTHKQPTKNVVFNTTTTTTTTTTELLRIIILYTIGKAKGRNLS